MPHDYDRWVVALKAREAERLKVAIDLQRALVFATLGAAVPLPGGGFARIPGVILRMPVDTGRARSSVNVSVGAPDRSVPPEGNYPSVPDTLASARGTLRSLRAYQTVWISSALVYVPVLELGGYPDPVLRGTWDKTLGRYVVKSANGYSKQAPQGMFGVTFEEIRAILGARGR